MIEVDESYIEDLKWKLEQSRIRCANLELQLDKAKEENSSLDFRIRTELEPRIKQEERCYDLWVSQQTGAEECEHFIKVGIRRLFVAAIKNNRRKVSCSLYC